MFIKKTLTAAQINAIDAAEVTLATLKTNTSMARIPERVVIYKAAGTAYTVSSGARIVIRDSGNQVLFSIPAEGFLDQATEQGRVQEADMSGKAFKSGGVTSFTIDSTASIASGTGSVTVYVFFDEQSVIF